MKQTKYFITLIDLTRKYVIKLFPEMHLVEESNIYRE